MVGKRKGYRHGVREEVGKRKGKGYILLGRRQGYVGGGVGNRSD